MSKYAAIKTIIDQVVTTNGQQEITGALLNEVLKAMVDSLGSDYQFGGVVEPSSNVGTPDQNVFYFALKAGTYIHFNSAVIPNGLSILMWDGSWSNRILIDSDNSSDILYSLDNIKTKTRISPAGENIGTVIKENGVVNIGGTSWRTISYSVTPGNLLRLGCSTYECAAYAFYHDNTLLSIHGLSTAASTIYKFFFDIVPNGCNKVVITNDIHYEAICDLMTELEIIDDIKPIWNQNHYFNYTTKTIDAYTGVDCAKIYPKAGAQYHIRGISHYYASFIVLMQNDTILARYSMNNNATVYVDEKIIIPYNCTHAYINFVHYTVTEALSKYGPMDVLMSTVFDVESIPLSVIGDSMSVLSTLGSYGLPNYVSFLEKDGFDIENLAFDGAGYVTVPGHTFPQQATLATKKNVIIFGLCNDVWSGTEETIRTALISCINTLRTNISDVNILVLSTIPRVDLNMVNARTIAGVNTTEWANKTKQLDNMLESVCNDYSVPFFSLFRHSGIHFWDVDFYEEYSIGDGIHPNSLGHLRFLYPIIKNLCLKYFS